MVSANDAVNNKNLFEFCGCGLKTVDAGQAIQTISDERHCRSASIYAMPSVCAGLSGVTVLAVILEDRKRNGGQRPKTAAAFD